MKQYEKRELKRLAKIQNRTLLQQREYEYLIKEFRMGKNKWLDWLGQGLDVAKVIAGATPVGAALTVLDAVVDSTNKESGVNNDDVIETITLMMKSNWNSLTPEKVERIKVILSED